MKRRRPISPPIPIPKTPPTPQTIRKTLQSNTPSLSSGNSGNSIVKFCSARMSTNLISPDPKTDPKTTLFWDPLRLGKSELSLPLTFPTGQTFRWKQTGPVQYTGVVKSHLVSLKQLLDGDNAYCFHHTANDASAGLLDLLDFLNVHISLTDLWKTFSDSDSRFAELAPHLGGARVLRQDPLECLIQFLCSSNNNIRRITGMVDYISSLGRYLGTVEGFQFHEFPSLERLSLVSENELREAGFGYR